MLNFKNLPFNKDSLNGLISSEAIDLHYGKHHKTYFENLKKLIFGTDLEKEDLVSIIKKTYGYDNLRAVFNNAAQVFNHDFYWQSISPKKTEPSSFSLQEIENSFSSLDDFKRKIKNIALNRFGSGWAWVVLKGGKIEVNSTPNAENPLIHDQEPLICVDVWEHAYYPDYQNKRAEYLDVFVDKMFNWEFFELNLKNGINKAV
jgi:superoxide dismutase, Fe-Mn family